MTHIFSSLKIKDITLRNRIGVSPMCQYSSIDGMATDWHFAHLGSRAVGGAGLVIVEATAVEPRGRISPQDAGLWSDRHIEPLARITKFIKEQGAVPGIQLAHAGRKGSASRPGKGTTHWPTRRAAGRPLPQARWLSDTSCGAHPRRWTRQISPRSRVPLSGPPSERYESVINGWSCTLPTVSPCHSFYSPLSNLRTDRYGGSLQNRIRFVLETFAAMREVWPENLPFSVRISCSDWVDGGPDYR